MFERIKFLVSHGVAIAAGFALGVYLLPIITAPDAPSDSAVASVAAQAMFRTSFRKDLPGSDFLHWGEGEVSISAGYISFSGEIAPGPDYRLYLAPQLALTEAEFLPIKEQSAYIGDIKTFDNFILEVPKSINPADYKAVLIWCESFGEFITAAGYGS